MGNRSAYWPIHSLQLKGCRPVSGFTFPHFRLDFGAEQVVKERVPFGTLTAEAVTRELLGYCFFMEHGLGVLTHPVAVMRYAEFADCFCLVSSGPAVQRLEAHETCQGLSLKDAIVLTGVERRFPGLELMPKLPAYNGLSDATYAKKKADVLLRMNFAGGFRGVLNSNMGNEAVVEGEFRLCDFDTFTVLREDFCRRPELLRGAVLWCLVELLKSSPTVLAFENLDGLDQGQVVQRLWATYTLHSKLWQHYWAGFVERAQSRGVPFALVQGALDEALTTQVVRGRLLEAVLNSQAVGDAHPLTLSYYREQTPLEASS